MTFKVGSMFAGIGGICQAFESVGVRVVWANESDSHACKTYRLNLGGAPFLVEEDIRAVDAESIPDIDILTAGFPCQAFSIAGHRKGFDDERGTLFYEIIRIIRAKKPRAVFLENVKNLKTHDSGRTFSTISSLLTAEGYEVVVKVLNSTEYGGLPQNRERIYIVAFRKDDDGMCPEMVRFKFPKPVALTISPMGIIDRHTKVMDKYYYKPDGRYFAELNEALKNPNSVYQWRRVYVRENKSNVCPTLTANMGTGGHNVPIIRDDYGIRKLTPEECLRFQGFPETFRFPELADSHKYKQVGNSVSVPVVARIAQCIVEAIGRL